MPRVAVVGAGAWGTVFAQVCADAGSEVSLLTSDAAVAAAITERHINPRNLPRINLPPGVVGHTSPKKALGGADLVAVAAPAQKARAVMTKLAGFLPRRAYLVSLMKGIESGTGERMSQVLAQAAGWDPERVAVVSGPNLAGELARRQPGATVVACTDESVARDVGAAFATAYLRPYTNPDVIGVEVCGAVKNVIALAVGAAQGLGFGLNTRATLMTRGLAEMTRLGLALGADVETFAGLAGFGDVAATCLSELSRNHAVGLHLGQGMSLDQAVAATFGTAEAVWTAPAVCALAKPLGVEMPIAAGVVAVVSGQMGAAAMGRELLGRPLRSEGSRYEAWPD
jgi:glycerol-3-phosphate dehydrogenase (NAD(P)+)